MDILHLERSVLISCARAVEQISSLYEEPHEYIRNYASYLLMWHKHIPISTIIIGQNPYPQPIWSLIGSAFSYEDSLTSRVPVSVTNLAQDLYVYDKTPISDTVECMKNSWALLDQGTILINQTVLDDIHKKDSSNLRQLREMEYQLQLLFIVITASYFAGCKEFTVVAMGERAALMMDKIKEWNPSDLMKIRTMACRNPAARVNSDRASQYFTLEQSGVSKVLSAQVKKYASMPPRSTPQERLAKQNQQALATSLEIIVSASSEVTATGNEIQGILKDAHEKNLTVVADVDNVIDLSDKFKAYSIALAKAANGLHTFNIANLARENDASANHKQKIGQQEQGSSRTPDISALFSDAGPRSRKAIQQSESNASEQIDITQQLSKALRLERQVSSMSMSSSVAGSRNTSRQLVKAMNETESSHMYNFSSWFKQNYESDPLPGQHMEDAARTKSVEGSVVAKKILKLIRQMMLTNPLYDSEKELSTIGSMTHSWVTQYTDVLKNNA